MTAILIMSAKFANPGILKIKGFFWNNGSDIISAHEINNKILTRNSHYTVGAVIWQNFGKFVRKFDLTKKNFFWGVVLDQNNNNMKMLLDMSLKFYNNVAKSNEVTKLWGLVPTGRNGRKTGRGVSGPFYPLSWIRLRKPDK